MEDNPTPEPNQPVAPEASGVAPAPAQEPQAPEAPLGVTDEPASTINPFDPAASTTPDAAPVAAPAPKKKHTGLIIGLVVGLLVLLGGGAFAYFYLTSHTPDKLVSTALANYMTSNVSNFSVVSNSETLGQKMDYTVDTYIPDGKTAYIRITGFDSILGFFGSLISAFTGESTGNLFSAIDGVWWKTELDSDESEALGSFIGGVSAPQKSLATAYKNHPFLKGEAINAKYETSGTAYKISIDSSALEAFLKEAGEDTELKLGPIVLSETEPRYSSLVFTVKATLLGEATLTGAYAEVEVEGGTSKISINFEKDLSSAVNEAKDVSELEEILNGMFGDSTEEPDAEEVSARDTSRRNDYAALATNITTYMANNAGKLPEVGVLDATKYINETGKDPSGHDYHLEVVDYAEEYEMSWGVNEGDTTNVYVVLHATCDDDNLLADTDAPRAFAIAGSLEYEYTNYYCMASI